ncbi:MAG: putative transporter [Acidimicrobiales bacterium]|nr:putative transporter [Acidimicrobiales bacterium]
MHLLRRRSFALLFAGTAVNAIGSWTALIALWGFATFRFDVGAGKVVLVILAWSIPAALAGPFAGVPIDRYGPKRVLMTADALGVVAALAMLLAHSYEDLIWCGILMGLAKAFSQPAAASLPPRVVDDADLVPANALLGAAGDSAIVFGPLVATGAIALWGFHAAFVIDALTYVVAIVAVSTLRLRPLAPTARESFRRELAEGYRLTARNPALLLTMALSTAVYLTWGSFAVVEPLYVRDVLGESTTVFALLQVAFGLGLVGAGIVVVRLGDRVATMRALAFTVLLSGAAAGLYVGTRSVIVAGIGVFLWGVDVAFFAAPARSLLQRHAPVEAHGRVLALHSTLHAWGDLVALPVTGLLAQAFGVQHAALAFAALAVAAGLAGYAASRRLEVAPDTGPVLATA